MLSAPSSIARRDIMVKIVVPTSGSLLSKRMSVLQPLQAACKGADAEPQLAQLARRGEASLSGSADEQVLRVFCERRGIREKRSHGNVARRGRPDSELFRRAHVDEAERAGGFLERVERDLDVRVIALELAHDGAARRDAFAPARGFELRTGERREVHEQQLALELSAHLEQDF